MQDFLISGEAMRVPACLLLMSSLYCLAGIAKTQDDFIQSDIFRSLNLSGNVNDARNSDRETYYENYKDFDRSKPRDVGNPAITILTDNRESIYSHGKKFLAYVTLFLDHNWAKKPNGDSKSRMEIFSKFISLFQDDAAASDKLKAAFADVDSVNEKFVKITVDFKDKSELSIVTVPVSGGYGATMVTFRANIDLAGYPSLDLAKSRVLP